jgi:DNA polymerase I-like protein with 3'-5' exonuclease and polymerase domains
MQSGHNLQNAPTTSYKASNIRVIFLMTRRPTLKSYEQLEMNLLDGEVIRDEKVVKGVTPFTGFGLGEGDT